MAIASDILRGSTDLIILAHLLRKDSYGYEINKSISEITKGEYELKEATLYTTFRRLEETNMIESYWGEGNSAARRRYYKITELGKKYYNQTKKEWEETQKMISKLINI